MLSYSYLICHRISNALEYNFTLGTYLTSLFVTSTEPCVVSLCGISDVENECQRNFEVLSASSFLLKKNRME
jgi:hypothetical protein